MDSDPIIVERYEPDDFTTIVGSLIGSIRWKSLILMFLVFILINTDVFVNRILGKIKGAVIGESASTKGVIIQGIFLVISCIIIDAAIKQNVI